MIFLLPRFQRLQSCERRVAVSSSEKFIEELVTQGRALERLIRNNVAVRHIVETRNGVERPRRLLIVAEECHSFRLRPDEGTVALVDQDLVVGVSSLLHFLVVDVGDVAGDGGSLVVALHLTCIAVVNFGGPRKQNDTSVAENFVKKQLTG